ncbi:type III toxin-antitoxin system ToxN/AbiQ family toxin [Marinilactibacillus psychrotolerans]|uniref:type III toxin-antitoxin system ToxN/AbiQ family toxin n=1 Tax=Marinilactibacillus psychrotolerans TaxID=191770 RepID=UPI00388B0702
MKLYRVTDDYIEKLREIDERVCWNKSDQKQRPYCGTVLEIGEINYFVPMSSPKEKSGNTQWTIKILGNDETDKLGSLQYQYMIPVPPSELINLDPSEVIRNEDEKYGNLLLKQYFFIRGNEERIGNKALKVYNIRNSGNVEYFNKNCVDFKSLEKAHDLYIRGKTTVIEDHKKVTDRINYLSKIIMDR